jgi:hypothetical protein
MHSICFIRHNSLVDIYTWKTCDPTRRSSQLAQLLSERLPEIKDLSGSDLSTAIYDEFNTAMLPFADWKEFHSTPFETTTVAAAIRIVETFSQAILEDLNKGNVKDEDFVQPKSLNLMESFLKLGRRLM